MFLRLLCFKSIKKSSKLHPSKQTELQVTEMNEAWLPNQHWHVQHLPLYKALHLANPILKSVKQKAAQTLDKCLPAVITVLPVILHAHSLQVAHLGYSLPFLLLWKRYVE
jgi:hypothetical protein